MPMPYFVKKLLAKKYPINRPLTAVEQEQHLDPRVSNDVRPRTQRAVIRINSTYLEVADYFYRTRGFGVAGGLASFGLTWAWFGCLWITILRWNVPETDRQGDVLFLIGAAVFFGAIALVGWQFLGSEAFGLTHYPIRMNRKNRMVYAFQQSGPILRVPWDRLSFCYEYNSPKEKDSIQPFGDVLAHVMAEDGITVLNTIRFCNPTRTLQGASELWEYMRRYMENGPEEPYANTAYCLPVTDRKEPFWFGFQYHAMGMFNGIFIAQLLFSWGLLAVAIGRYIANLTSKIPVWPQDIEDACRIEPDDPYAKDWRSNRGFWAKSAPPASTPTTPSADASHS